jgi:hypothetical protein
MDSESKVDLNRLLLKPVYIGLVMNILVPVILLAFVYYLDGQNFHKGVIISSKADPIFWALCGVALLEGIAAFIIRKKLFFSPMVRSKETFEEDLVLGFLTNSIICYAITTAISIYGVVLFFLGHPFETTVLFVLISMIAYQFIRPRFKFTGEVVEAQDRLVSQGRFAPPKK